MLHAGATAAADVSGLVASSSVFNRFNVDDDDRDSMLTYDEVIARAMRTANVRPLPYLLAPLLEPAAAVELRAEARARERLQIQRRRRQRERWRQQAVLVEQLLTQRRNAVLVLQRAFRAHLWRRRLQHRPAAPIARTVPKQRRVAWASDTAVAQDVGAGAPAFEEPSVLSSAVPRSSSATRLPDASSATATASSATASTARPLIDSRAAAIVNGFRIRFLLARPAVRGMTAELRDVQGMLSDLGPIDTLSESDARLAAQLAAQVRAKKLEVAAVLDGSKRVRLSRHKPKPVRRTTPVRRPTKAVSASDEAATVSPAGTAAPRGVFNAKQRAAVPSSPAKSAETSSPRRRAESEPTPPKQQRRRRTQNGDDGADAASPSSPVSPSKQRAASTPPKPRFQYLRRKTQSVPPAKLDLSHVKAQVDCKLDRRRGPVLPRSDAAGAAHVRRAAAAAVSDATTSHQADADANSRSARASKLPAPVSPVLLRRRQASTLPPQQRTQLLSPYDPDDVPAAAVSMAHPPPAPVSSASKPPPAINTITATSPAAAALSPSSSSVLTADQLAAAFASAFPEDPGSVDEQGRPVPAQRLFQPVRGSIIPQLGLDAEFFHVYADEMYRQFYQALQSDYLAMIGHDDPAAAGT